MNNEKNIEIFRNAPVPKAVISNVIPSIISMIMVLVYNLADAFFIGQTKDALMFAAVSLATPVFLIFMAVGMLFGIGGTSFISRSLGQGDYDKAKKISSFCFWTGLVVGIVSTVSIVLLAEPISWGVGASAESIGYTKQYLGIVALGIPFLIMSNIFSNVLRAEGHAKIAMAGVIIGNVVNIVFDPIMILGLRWNVAGAAIATVLGNLVSAAFYLVHLLSPKTMLSIKLKDYRAGQGIASGVFAIGVPASLNSILMSTSNIIINNVMKDYGDMAVAGLGVAMKVNMIAVMLLIGLGSGVQPLLGYCFGVFFFFSIIRSVLFKSDCGRVKESSFFSDPPQRPMAFFETAISSPTFSDLYGMKNPPTFANGRQYSLSVARLETARETTISYCSRYSALCPSSSALA